MCKYVCMYILEPMSVFLVRIRVVHTTGYECVYVCNIVWRGCMHIKLNRILYTPVCMLVSLDEQTIVHTNSFLAIARPYTLFAPSNHIRFKLQASI